MAKSKLETIQKKMSGYRAAMEAVQATKPEEIKICLAPENLEEIEKKLGHKAIYASLCFDPYENEFNFIVDGSNRYFPTYIAKPLLNALRYFIEEDSNVSEKT
jgi:hypothetical protein